MFNLYSDIWTVPIVNVIILFVLSPLYYINAKRKKKKYDGTSVLYQQFSCATRKYFEIAEALSKLQSSKAVRSGLIERDGRKGSSGDRSSSGETDNASMAGS